MFTISLQPVDDIHEIWSAESAERFQFTMASRRRPQINAGYPHRIVRPYQAPPQFEAMNLHQETYLVNGRPARVLPGIAVGDRIMVDGDEYKIISDAGSSPHLELRNPASPTFRQMASAARDELIAADRAESATCVDSLEKRVTRVVRGRMPALPSTLRAKDRDGAAYRLLAMLERGDRITVSTGETIIPVVVKTVHVDEYDTRDAYIVGIFPNTGTGIEVTHANLVSGARTLKVGWDYPAEAHIDPAAFID